MKTGTLKAKGGRIIVDIKFLKSMLQGGLEEKLQLAIDDGWVDYNYCKGQVKISEIIENKVKGFILFDDKWEQFEGNWSDGEIEFEFEFSMKDTVKENVLIRILRRLFSIFRPAHSSDEAE